MINKLLFEQQTNMLQRQLYQLKLLCLKHRHIKTKELIFLFHIST